MSKTLSELVEKTSASDSDVLLIENSTSTNKITKANFLKEITQELSDSNQSVEGSYVTVNGSKEGGITDIEIFGNTVQDSSNLADIQSVGTLQEDGLYKMSILSCGKNLFNGKMLGQGYINPTTGDVVSHITNGYYDFIRVKGGENLYLSKQGSLVGAILAQYDKDKKFIVAKDAALPRMETLNSNTRFIRISVNFGKTVTQEIADNAKIQIEEGTVATTYEPYQYSKTSILLPCQLEKVGDVADRLFKREDGVWCVEKNVESRILDGSEGGWSKRNDGDGINTISFHSQFSGIRPKSLVISDKFPLDGLSSTNGIEGVSIDNTTFLIEIQRDKLPSADLSGFKTWLMQNHLLIKYASVSPQIIELPLDAQIQLNSVNGITNIFTVDAVIEPTIKATVPKSLGASVNSLVNKTDILSDRVEAVEKLKEGTELEVSTESGYVVCENTNNGQIEGLKVEGKTLVNLFDINNNVYKTESIRSDTSGKSGFVAIGKDEDLAGNLIVEDTSITCGHSTSTYRGFGMLLQNLKANTDYTIIMTKTGVSLNPNTTIKLTDGLNVFKVTTTTEGKWYGNAENSVTGTFIIKDIIILEGDHTQNPPSYFEGLKSVGDRVGKIEALSRKEDGNLLSLENLENKFITNNDGSISSDTTRILTDFIHLTPGNTYTWGNYGTLAFNTIVYDVNKKITRIVNRNTSVSITLTSNERYIRWHGRKEDTSTFTIEEFMNCKLTLTKGNTQKPYEPYQSNKKQILYQTKEGVLEKPILRSVGNVSDTIEKHSDGKYYYHKRCEATLLNGSENGWTKSATITGRYYIDNLFKTIVNPTVKLCISNKYTSLSANESDTGLKGIACTNGNKLMINTSFDTLELFKSDLQTNNATVVYQLATEEVYECVNLDLDSYEGETSIIFDGGAISPKLTFKIASHIGNTISVLKDRINYLEDKVISMFKSVLAGDVQTLAYELYPEDFEEEVVENDIVSDEIELL